MPYLDLLGASPLSSANYMTEILLQCVLNITLCTTFLAYHILINNNWHICLFYFCVALTLKGIFAANSCASISICMVQSSIPSIFCVLHTTQGHIPKKFTEATQSVILHIRMRHAASSACSTHSGSDDASGPGHDDGMLIKQQGIKASSVYIW
jgi:hypothetical protein